MNSASKDDKALSFKFKNHRHRATVAQKRERSGSNEEAIRSDIASDIQIENSDELAISQGIDLRKTGRDFSCVFDADSDGPK